MLRVSLRELMAFVACAAVALVSLKFASDIWLAAVIGVAMALLFAALVLMAVDRGPRQAFAIGFVLVVLGYYAVLFYPPYATSTRRATREFALDGLLPTTRVLQYVHTAVVHNRYFDANTGQEVPNYDPSNAAFANMSVGANELPPREYFLPIGHAWWALLFGYLGGRFAQFIYARRTTTT